MPRQRLAADADVRAVLDSLRRIVQALRAGTRDTGRGALSTAQLFALEQIARHPGVSINDLADLTFTHQSSVSVVVQRLVERRLVVRLPSAGDRRRSQLEATPAGQRFLRTAPDIVQQRLIAGITALPPRDRTRIVGGLTDLARIVAPVEGSTAPPMLFEDSRRRRRATAPARRRHAN
jgi:MarR family transcriptional regulator, lower aerobic nicotinate degradation pathway regulator